MSQVFRIIGKGAVWEHVKARPEGIVEILCNPRISSDIRRLYQEKGYAGVFHEDPAVKEVEAVVRIALVGIDSCYPNWHVRQRGVVVMLDSVTDPRNLGAIIRSCAFFGVPEVIVRNTRQVSLTDVVVQTARGGFAHCNLVTCNNLSREVRRLKEAGYWVVGASPTGEPLQRWRGKFEKIVLVLGAEGAGISHNLSKLCDVMVAVEGAPDPIESLNVSVAAGVLLYSLQF